MLPSLDGLAAKEIRELIVSAEKRLKELEEEQRRSAISQIRELAATAGLKVQIDDRKVRPITGVQKAGGTASGLKFIHPDDPKKFYVVNRGRKPQWVRDLEAQGVAPS